MRVGEHGAERGRETVGVLGSTTIGSWSATPRQRALVAALVLAGREGAGIDELADGVWAGRPPSSARSSLQNQMTRLRRAHGDGIVVCHQARYRLGWSTDVEQFEQTLARARSAPITRTTIESLSDAMSLWRGMPYADLADSHGAEIERARLTQERGRAADLLATARIGIRDYEQCIAELRVEVEDDPYRDRAWELLFVALQRAGRPGEALVAHQDYVERLRHQFGVEPSGRLVDMGRILRLGTPLDLVSSNGVPLPEATRDMASCRRDPMTSRCRARGRRPGRVDP